MKKTTAIRALAVSAGLVATLWPTSGTAHLQSRPDPVGDAPKLDIVQASFDDSNGNFILSFKTASPWTKGDVFDSECGKSAFQGFTLDVYEDSYPDYSVEIYVDKDTKTFDANLYDLHYGWYDEKGNWGTITKTRRSLTIEFPKTDLSDADGKTPRWRVSSSSDEELCVRGSSATYDSAPDKTDDDFATDFFRHKG